jgi:ERCC4-type nuclease
MVSLNTLPIGNLFMVLYVDDRENSVVIHKLFARLGDRDQDNRGQVQVKRLPSADYVIGDWGIEAKEINDLYHSIHGHGRSRTIVGQLVDLADDFTVPMLVVYGNKYKPFIPGRKRKPKRSELDDQIVRMKQTVLNFKTTFQLRFPKIQFMQFDTMDDFVTFLVTAHTQKVVIGVDKPTKDAPKILTTNPQVLALSSLPGITEQHAIDLLEKFGSLRNILRLRTSQKDLMEIEGIGRKKAKDILSLREQYQS